MEEKIARKTGQNIVFRNIEDVNLLKHIMKHLNGSILSKNQAISRGFTTFTPEVSLKCGNSIFLLPVGKAVFSLKHFGFAVTGGITQNNVVFRKTTRYSLLFNTRIIPDLFSPCRTNSVFFNIKKITSYQASTSKG